MENTFFDIAKNSALAAGSVLKQGLGKKHRLYGKITKSGSRSDLSTAYDKISNYAIKEIIKSEFTKYPFGIISEEEKESGGIKILEGSKEDELDEEFISVEELRKLEYVWVIDPLCGSILYQRGIKDFIVSISLLKSGEIILGLVYDPGHDELFHAEKDNGAFLLDLTTNIDKPISVSKVSALKKDDDKAKTGALVSVEHKMIREDQTINFVYEISKPISRLRVAGSCGLELCYVACGRTDAMLRARQPIYDYSAGKIIVEKAGGKVTDFRGDPIQVNLDKEQKTDIFASNDNIHGKIITMLSQSKKNP
jgi:myo-inositol-1(or 4)-monophosphatase